MNTQDPKIETQGAVTREQALNHINEKFGKFFTVVFIKRTNGEERRMLCRQGVKVHLAGGPPAYNFKEKDLIPVWDVQKAAYRSIPKEAITHIMIDGVWYNVED